MIAKPAAALALALLASATPLALARAAQPAPAAAASGALATPAIPFKTRTLANGLKVYTAVDHSAPTVSVQVWYGVGSKDDPQGRSGFAHLFEHMMFKATRDMPAEYMDRLTEDVGGQNNASTWDDFTNYYEVIPSNHLERLLWAEAQRMSSLKVDQANFTSERAVVEEELRQSYLANPYGRLQLATSNAAYDVHPYKRSGIGSLGDLDAATLSDVKAFHDTYYRPQNASLIVVGDFDQAQLDRWIDRDFGGIKNPAVPMPRVAAVEPPRTAPKVVDAYAPIVPLPAVRVLWHIPAAKDPDFPALQVLDAVLSAGKSSRLYDHLVYRDRIALRVNSDAGQNAQPGLFELEAILAGGKTVEQGEAALLAEAKALRDGPVAADEIARAKTQLIAQILRQRETVLGRGMQIGFAIAYTGEAERANTEAAALQAVTAADLQRVARKYLRDEARIVVRYRAESARPKGAPAEPDLAQFSPKVKADALPPGVVAPPPPETLARQIPAPAPAREAQPPKIAERTLPNGLRVIVSRTSDVPLVSAVLTVKSGAAVDPALMTGLQGFTAGLLPQGTATRSAPQIAAEVEALGGSLAPQTGADHSGLALTVPVDKLGAALPLLADVALHPAFAPAEIDRLRAQRLDALKVSLTQPGYLARVVAARAVFGDSPYGRSTTPASLSAITRDAVIGQYAATFRPDSAVLVMTGGLDPEAAFALAEKTFGGWAKPPGAPPAPAPSVPTGRRRIIAVDIPGAGQAAVAVAAPSIGRDDPAFFPVEVINAVLGGGYSARLNEEVRVKRGLSYGAGSSVDERRGVGLFYASAQTKNPSAAEVAGLVDDLVKKLGDDPIPAAEFDARKASLIGERGLAVQQSLGMAGVLTEEAVYGVPLDEVGRYTGRITAVDAAAAKAAAKAAVDPDKASIIVAGDAKTFLPALKAKYPQVEMIAAADVVGK
jgi:zinc protease